MMVVVVGSGPHMHWKKSRASPSYKRIRRIQFTNIYIEHKRVTAAAAAPAGAFSTRHIVFVSSWRLEKCSSPIWTRRIEIENDIVYACVRSRYLIGNAAQIHFREATAMCRHICGWFIEIYCGRRWWWCNFKCIKNKPYYNTVGIRTQQQNGLINF